MVATGIFVAVGSTSQDTLSKIGYSTDGQNWFVSTNTNGLFSGEGAGAAGGGGGTGSTYGNGLFVAVGDSTAGGNANIGYSTDGQTWTLAKNTNGLFGGEGVSDGGYDVTYGNGLFVAVGVSTAGGNANIGYSTDGQTWTLAT